MHVTPHSSGQWIATVGVLATIIAIVVAIIAWVFPNPLGVSEAVSEDHKGTMSVTVATAPETTIVSETAAGGSTLPPQTGESDTSKADQMSEYSPAPEASETSQPQMRTGGIDEIVVETEISTSVGLGKKIGPGEYQLASGRATPELRLSYRWEGRSDSVPVESEDCAINVTMEGPSALPGYKSAECSIGFKSWFSTSATNLQIYEPGEYTIHIYDRLSEVTGTFAFTVEA